MNSQNVPMKRVWIIHDEPVEARIAERILGRRDWDVHVFLDPLEGLHQAIESPPDLVLAALEMTELNGDELCVYLRSHPATKGVPVVLLSDRNESEGREIAEFSGAAGHIETRVAADLLVGAVRGALHAADRSRKASRSTAQNSSVHALLS
jgi:CheY-like chemotaxis protein